MPPGKPERLPAVLTLESAPASGPFAATSEAIAWMLAAASAASASGESRAKSMESSAAPPDLVKVQG